MVHLELLLDELCAQRWVQLRKAGKQTQESIKTTSKKIEAVKAEDVVILGCTVESAKSKYVFDEAKITSTFEEVLQYYVRTRHA